MPAHDRPTDTSDVALFGSDPLPRIVDVQPLLYSDQTRVRVYRRSDDGETVSAEEEPFFPFFFLADIELLRGFSRDRFQYQTLKGDNYFRHIVVFRSWSDYWDGVRHVERTTGRDQPEELYRIGSPIQQYLMQSGRTCFKGMTLDDVHRLQLDIETYSESGFPNASRPNDEVIIVALHDNRGWHRILHARDRSEAALLRELVDVIRERDPDVIEGHNIFAFDFDYLLKRCKRHGISFAVGRDGSEPRTFPSSMRFAERSVDFPAMEIAGRHIVDTYFQVMAFDVFKRDLPGYGLKDAARYFGFAPEGRTYVDGDQIARVWREDPDRLIDYALDDVIETERLARHLSGSNFYLTQMLPMPYGQVARTGPAAKIEALFVREYLRQRHAFPKSEWGSQAMGGYTDIFYTGVAGPIVYADVESLYPSIMLNYDIEPEGDDLHLFATLLHRLTDLRFDAKRKMKAASGDVRGELDARQSSYKVLINCFDPDTEVMTIDGRKNVQDVVVGDRVYSLNPDTMQAEIKPVTYVHTQERYRGPMARLQNRHIDFLVTPNHRILTNKVNGYRETGYVWRKVEDLFDTKCRHYLPPRSPVSGGPAPHRIDLAAECRRLGIAFKTDENGRIKELRQQASWIPRYFSFHDWLTLMGWYISEGHLYKSTRKDYGYTVRGESYVVGINNKTEHHRDEIRSLLDRMDLNHSEDVNGFTLSNRLLHHVLARDCGVGSLQKQMPRWVFEFAGADVLPMFESMYKGDGDQNRFYRYSTISRRLADDTVQLAHHIGYNAQVLGRDSGCHRVGINPPGGRGTSPVVKAEHRYWIDYDGPIHCITVADNHTVLAGRNGKFNWIGQSFYGSLGFSLSLFNDFSEADRVASTGQQILRQIIRLIQQRGGTVIEVDTDGVLFVPPDGVRGEEAEHTFLDGLNEEMPEGIRIGFDGRYEKMLSYKKKNYALLTYEGTLKFKGSSLISRSNERFGRRFVRRAIERLLEEDVQGLHDLYLSTRERIETHRWEQGVDSFSRTETLKDTAEQYEADVEAGKRTRAASYELAIAHARETGRAPRKGDRISYYITGSSASVTAFENSRLADEWNPEAPDENTAYYLKRLDEFARKFEPFLTEHDFRLVFSPEDLFGFSAEGIEIQAHEHEMETQNEEEEEVPF